MKNVTISVVVPAYNVEKYIINTIQSICEQTYREIEIILVDDGSTDKTPDILDKLLLQDARIKVIHKENGGVTSARLRGVQEANGEWIGFVDGDDYIEPYMYEMLLKNALDYDADVSHCGYQMVFPSRTDFYYGTGRLSAQDKKTGLKDLLEGSFVEPGLWNKLFHKNLFRTLLHEGKMDLSIKNTEDLLMNYYLFRNSNRAVFIDECPYHYIVRKDSAANAKLNRNKLEDPIKVMKIIKKDSSDMPEIHKIAEEKLFEKYVNIAVMSCNENKELIKPFRKSIRKELRNNLSYVIFEPKIKRFVKVKVIWATLFPDSYRWIHHVYAKITGLDNKYDIE